MVKIWIGVWHFQKSALANVKGLAARHYSWPIIRMIIGRTLELIFQNSLYREGMHAVLQALGRDAVHPTVWVALSVSPGKYIISCNGDTANRKNVAKILYH